MHYNVGDVFVNLTRGVFFVRSVKMTSFVFGSLFHIIFMKTSKERKYLCKVIP